LIVAGAVALFVAIGFLMRRLGGRTPEPSPPAATSERMPSSSAESNGSSSVPGQTTRLSVTPMNQETAGEPPSATVPVTDWNDKVDAILTSGLSESDKVKRLLQIFPHLPEGGQMEVATHLSNLAPNQDYASLLNLLTNSQLSPDVLDVFFRDALNRPNRLKLPALLEIARNQEHPNAADAKETLAFLLEEDDGDDWAKWQTKIDEWLAANPD
jgi:hypothetical protein